MVAEGIESTEQLDVLQALGCDQGQGFIYAEPLEDEAAFVRTASRRFARGARVAD